MGPYAFIRVFYFKEEFPLGGMFKVLKRQLGLGSH
jgi:hypothetical protein